jgi:hypothetical protein
MATPWQKLEAYFVSKNTTYAKISGETNEAKIKKGIGIPVLFFGIYPLY